MSVVIGEEECDILTGKGGVAGSEIVLRIATDEELRGYEKGDYLELSVFGLRSHGLSILNRLRTVVVDKTERFIIVACLN